MDRKHIVMGVTAILLLLSVFQLVQLNRLSNQITGNVVASSVASDGKIDTTGWTENEIMNYEMHGTIPARLQGRNVQTSLSSSGMVGGC